MSRLFDSGNHICWNPVDEIPELRTTIHSVVKTSTGRAYIIRAPSQYKDRLIFEWRFPCLTAVLSLTWESPYLGRPSFLLRRPPGAVITLSNITWYCVHYCCDWSRIYISDWIHKRHPITLYGVSLVRNLEKIDQVIMATHCIFRGIFDLYTWFSSNSDKAAALSDFYRDPSNHKDSCNNRSVSLQYKHWYRALCIGNYIGDTKSSRSSVLYIFEKIWFNEILPQIISPSFNWLFHERIYFFWGCHGRDIVRHCAKDIYLSTLRL